MCGLWHRVKLTLQVLHVLLWLGLPLHEFNLCQILRTAPNWIALVVGVGGNGRWRGLMVWFRWRGCWLVHHGQTATAGSLGPPLFGHPAGWIGPNCWRAAWLARLQCFIYVYSYTRVFVCIEFTCTYLYLYNYVYIRIYYILCYDYVYTYIYTYRYTHKLHINTDMDCSEGDSWKFKHFGDGQRRHYVSGSCTCMSPTMHYDL